MNILLIFLFLLASGMCQRAIDTSNYPNSTELIPGTYTLYWKVNHASEEINLGLKVKTMGWISFGIAERTTGSMPGADVAVITFENDRAKLVDTYTFDFVYPAEDECQSWSLRRTSSDGEFRFVELVRKLDTQDSQDREIVAGFNKVIFAYGTNSQQALSYHESRRGATEVTFWIDPKAFVPTIDSDVKKQTYVLDFVVPDKTTTYTCMSYNIPLGPLEQSNHIIQIDPVIDPVSAKYVHHMLVHICANTSETSFVNRYQSPGECNSPIGDVDSDCTSLLFAWAVGGGPTVLPEAAGFRMGYEESGFTHLVLEMHYDNPENVAGVRDRSGFKITYTPKLRQHDAAAITLGDPLLFFGPIPAGKEATAYEAECPSECTQAFPHDIHVFGSLLHMHGVGSAMWSRQWRNGEDLGITNKAEFYSFHFQQTTSVNYTIKPGDRINTHCIYNTKSKTTPTVFGIESSQEMCIDFIFYYPRIISNGATYAYCGYGNLGEITGEDASFTVCGSLNDAATTLFRIDLPNPRNPDPSELNTIDFGKGLETCPRITYGRNVDVVGIAVGVSIGGAVFLVLVGAGIWYFFKRGSK